MIHLTQDGLGQLTEADYTTQTDENSQCDENGNRVGGGNVVGSNNRLTSDGVYNYSYDDEGNLVTKTRIATGEVTEYSYDHRHRLTDVVIKSAGGIILHEIHHIYDVMDRRIATTTDGQTSYHVYDGDHVWADFDASGIVTARYLYGDRIDQILARSRPSEGTVWYLTDHLGTVHDLMSSAGVVVNHITYSAFGQILTQTGATWSDRFTYTAREWDAVAQIYWYRSRWYDPSTARFLSEDGIRLDSGHANFYRYVGNAPFAAIDPTGMLQQSPPYLIAAPTLLQRAVAVLRTGASLTCAGLNSDRSFCQIKPVWIPGS